MMIITTSNLMPSGYKVGGVEVFVPMGLVTASHLLYPVALNPWFLAFSVSLDSVLAIAIAQMDWGVHLLTIDLVDSSDRVFSSSIIEYRSSLVISHFFGYTVCICVQHSIESFNIIVRWGAVLYAYDRQVYQSWP